MNAALARDSAKARRLLHTHIHDCVKHALGNSDWLRPAPSRQQTIQQRRKPKT
jgi:hypothetical protein